MATQSCKRVLGLAAAASLASLGLAQDSLDDYISEQRPLYLQDVLENIGSDGANVPGAGPGLVIASPSTEDPDYFYTWTRDSALTFKMIVDEFITNSDSNLESHIKDYIRSQAILQTVTNPSGSLLPNGRGLGEAKYMADGSRFNGAWGRPQNDGPPLRATALITYSKWLIEQGDEGLEEARDVIWPVIQNDLSYVGQYWNETNFDLWEEVSGSSFFTTQSQYRSLIEGAQLAETLGVSCGASCDEAAQIGCFLNNAYWNGEFYVANINTGTNRNGRDANTVLGSNHVFDVAASCDDPTVQPCHPRALATFKQWVDGWRDGDAYPINAGVPAGQGVAVGRYTEDVYYGGNPWYLITLGAAEFLYNAVAQWTSQSSVTVEATSLAFFRELYSSAAEGTFTDDTPEFDDIVSAVTTYADSFVEVVRNYTPTDGSLAEQYDRYTPFGPVGATDLTWSYAAFITMASRRAGEFPPSWIPSAPSLEVPSSCSASSARGTYAPAVAAGAPNNTEGLCTASVRFNVEARTYFGEDIYVIGNVPALGRWDVSSAQPLTADGYTDERPLWSALVDVDADQGTVEYVYVRAQNCGNGWIYETRNRTLEVPSCEEEEGEDAETVVVEDIWEGPQGSPGNC